MAFLVPHSAFWVNSAVARLVYQDYNRAGPLVTCAREQLEAHLAPLVAAAEANATAKWASGDVAGVAAVLSALAVEATAEATARWTALWMKLMVTLQDGSTAAEEPADLLCGCTKTAPVYEAAWLEKVVNDTHDHYRLPAKDCAYLDADGHCHPKAPPATTLAATPASAAMAATAPGTGLGFGAVPGTRKRRIGIHTATTTAYAPCIVVFRSTYLYIESHHCHTHRLERQLMQSPPK